MTDDLKAQTAALISYLEAHHGIGVDVVKEQAQQIATLTQERDIAVRDLRIEKYRVMEEEHANGLVREEQGRQQLAAAEALTQRLSAALQTLKVVTAWRGLDGDGITDPVRQQVLDAIAAAEECLSMTWQQAAAFEAVDMGNTQYAQGLDQCANELDELLGGVNEALGLR